MNIASYEVKINVVPSMNNGLNEGTSFFYNEEYELRDFVTKLIKIGIDSSRIEIFLHQ